MDLFRKSAMQKMLAPEDLEQLIQISKPWDWLALIGVCGILIAFIVWFFIGTIAINVPGEGILLKKDGYRIIESPITGQITKIIQFQQGDLIQKGEVIAEVAQPFLQLKVDAAKTYLTDLEELQKHTALNSSDNAQINLKITAAKANLQYLQEKLLTDTKIVSPYTGFFLALRANTGVNLKVGDSVLSMEDRTKRISAIVFLPPATSNIDAIKPGMITKVFPGLEKNTENGYLMGQVNTVSKYPVSPQIMTNLLNNDFLVNYFSSQGPPYMVDIDLMGDPKKLDAYQWSLATGHKSNINSGTLCTAYIQIANKSPISFLFRTP